MTSELSTVAELAESGWTASARQHAVAVGAAQRVRRGVLRAAVDAGPAPAWERLIAKHLEQAQAATKTCPRAVISHLAAAIGLALPVLNANGRPCLTVPSGTALRGLSGVHLHRAALTCEDIVEVRDYRYTSPARTVLDIAREHGVPAGVVATDAALQIGLVTPDSLGAAYERCAHWPGRVNARRTLLAADGRSESPLESLSRLRLAALYLPTPTPQVVIGDASGRFVARADFYWDDVGVIGEADGDLKYEVGRSTLVAERRREAALVDLGLIIVRWGWADLARFDVVANRLRMGFARGARRGSSTRHWTALRRTLHP